MTYEGLVAGDPCGQSSSSGSRLTQRAYYSDYVYVVDDAENPVTMGSVEGYSHCCRDHREIF